MEKYKLTLLPLLFLLTIGQAQVKSEREFRIRKTQFPIHSLEALEGHLEDARRIRYYKEIDSNATGYELKFKKKRLHYSVEFNEEGMLEDIEILIREVDIPAETLEKIHSELAGEFRKYRIRRMQQQYPVRDGEPVSRTIRNAFQNLLLPHIRYEITVAGKNKETFGQYEALFDASGKLIEMRTSLPANYDHILY